MTMRWVLPMGIVTLVVAALPANAARVLGNDELAAVTGEHQPGPPWKCGLYYCEAPTVPPCYYEVETGLCWWRMVHPGWDCLSGGAATACMTRVHHNDCWRWGTAQVSEARCSELCSCPGCEEWDWGPWNGDREDQCMTNETGP
jgi:hypothetical protein